MNRTSKPLLKHHQFDRLTSLRTFLDFALRSNAGANFFSARHYIYSIIDYVKNCYPHSSRMGFVIKKTEMSLARITIVNYIVEDAADEFEAVY